MNGPALPGMPLGNQSRDTLSSYIVCSFFSCISYEFDNMAKQNTSLGRREFLAALGATTYTLMVKADDLPQTAAAEASPDEIRDAFKTIVPDGELAARRFEGEPHMTLVDLQCDLLVAGGGPAGVCAAIAAARNGAKVVLVQDRSRLGGNSSSEVKMHVVGANMHTGRPGWREGGLIEEFRLDDAANNPQRSWELWDLLLYDKVVSEQSILFPLRPNHACITLQRTSCRTVLDLFRMALSRCNVF
jgi:hypothetical protein